MPKKFYVVWKGRVPGVYASWAEAKIQVDGFAGARHRSFETRAEAEQALLNPPPEKPGKKEAAEKPDQAPTILSELDVKRIGKPIADSYVVDAACSGNPGKLEYQCVHFTTGKRVFHQGPFEEGTNNIGEFLAIVHALALLKRSGSCIPIYSDSRNAIKWVEEKHCKTKLPRTERNAPLFEMIERAENWLMENDYLNRVIKWDTEAWGENPADFGRK